MNDLMLQLKRCGVTMDIYSNCPLTNGFKVRFRKIVNTEMFSQDYLIDIETLIGPYLSIDRIILEYLHSFVKELEKKESI